MTQTITSAETSVKQVPAILNKIIQIMRMPASYFASVRDVLDMGGGKYDLLTIELAKMGIRNWVYDPFNRSQEHNKFVVDMLTASGADMVLCSNVLNVIKEQDNRDLLHRIIKQCSRKRPGDCKIFFTVYEGDGTSKGKKTSKGWQANKPTKAYVRELRKYYYSVTLCPNKLIVCEGFKP